MPLPIDGSISHDAVDAGKPIKIGGKANSALPTAVDAGKRVDAWFDLFGRFIVGQYIPPTIRSGDTVGPKTVTLTATTNAALIATPGAGVSILVTLISASNGSATLTRLDIVEGGTDGGSDGTIIDSHWLSPGGGGFVKPYAKLWKLPANTALKARLSTGVTDVRVNLDFFVNA